jgi:hypothetical protein
VRRPDLIQQAAGRIEHAQVLVEQHAGQALHGA